MIRLAPQFVVGKMTYSVNDVRHTDQWTLTEHPEINPRFSGQLISDKSTNTIQWGKNSLSSNGAKTTGCMCACSVAWSCLTLLRPHGLQPTRLLCPRDSPGKNT